MRKIKRYNRIYTQKRTRKLLRFFGYALLCIILVFVGYSLYGPVQNFLSGSSDPQPSSSNTPSQSDISSQPTSSLPSGSSEPVTEATSMQGAYLPLSVLKEQVSLNQFIAFAKEQNINTVIIEMKTSDGIVNYNSALENVINAGAIADASFDIGQSLAYLKENNIKAIALMHIFQDRLAAKKHYSSAVKYSGTNTNWLDNSLASGGRPWLNPYNDFSVSYNLDIASELMDLGFTGIMADSVQFPSGFSLDLATYGENQSTLTRQQCLSNFITSFTDTIEAKGGIAILSTTVSASLSPTELIHGASSLLYGAKAISPFIVPASFGTKLAVADISIDSPAKDPYTTVSTVIFALKQKNADTQYIPFIECYTESGVSAESNKTYTLEDVASQIKALEEKGIQDYILYDPSGAYNLS